LRHHIKRSAILAAVLSIGGALWWTSQDRALSQTSRAARRSDPVTTGKVVDFLRERFGIPDGTKISAQPFRESPVAGYYETTVTVDDGTNKKDSTIFVSKDGRYLALGNFYSLSRGSNAEILQHVREQFKVPANVSLTASPPEKSKFSGFEQIRVTATGERGPQSQDFYITKDHHTLLLGNLYVLSTNLRAQALQTIVTANQPSVGPPHARVTIVEYADLQCPTCARFQEFLEKEFLPKYGDRVRVVFKEFPLPMHDWSLTAAIANECAYQIQPSAFEKYRTLIFANQGMINAANVRDQMLVLGEQAGIDKLKLAACIDSKGSLARVEAGRREGEKLGVASTPTIFINGRMVTGAPPADQFNKMVDEALAQAETKAEHSNSKARTVAAKRG
jgi:protein-disulfide isomerase